MATSWGWGIPASCLRGARVDHSSPAPEDLDEHPRKKGQPDKDAREPEQHEQVVADLDLPPIAHRIPPKSPPPSVGVS